MIYLALHPEGVHPNVLAGVLWPRGVTPDVSAAVVGRAREWLGDDVQGNPFLREDADGRLSLSDGVVCDWDAVRSLFLRARTSGSRREEVELLRRGLQLIRGESFAGHSRGSLRLGRPRRPRAGDASRRRLLGTTVWSSCSAATTTRAVLLRQPRPGSVSSPRQPAPVA